MNLEITTKEKMEIRRYVTNAIYSNQMNLLLHPDDTYEQLLYQEGKPFVIADEKALKELLESSKCIYTAMYRSTFLNLNAPVETKKVDRKGLLKEYKRTKQISCFFSTTQAPYFLDYYLKTKQEPVLLEIKRDPNLPFLDMQCIFGKDYAKPEEMEILLPPFSQVASIKALPPDPQYPNHPHYALFLQKATLPKRNMCVLNEIGTNMERAYPIVLPIMQKLEQRGLITPAEYQVYREWKKDIRSFMQGTFYHIEAFIQSLHDKKRH